MLSQLGTQHRYPSACTQLWYHKGASPVTHGLEEPRNLSEPNHLPKNELSGTEKYRCTLLHR